MINIKKNNYNKKFLFNLKKENFKIKQILL